MRLKLSSFALFLCRPRRRCAPADILSFVQGNCGEKTSKDLGITREDQDNYAIRSYKAAQVCVLKCDVGLDACARVLVVVRLLNALDGGDNPVLCIGLCHTHAQDVEVNVVRERVWIYGVVSVVVPTYFG